MKIKIAKINNGYMADILDIPGSPGIGLGTTPEDAVAELMLKTLYNSDISKPHINFTKLEIEREGWQSG